MAKPPKATTATATKPTAATQVEETVLETNTASETPETAEVVETVETTEAVKELEDDPLTEDPEEIVDTAPIEPVAAVVTPDYSLVQDIVYELERYQAIMAPRQSHQLSEGNIAQVSLYNAIKVVMEAPEPARFKQGMDLLVNWFSDNSMGCTNARYLFRYVATIPLSPTARTEFTRLLNLLTIAGEMKNNLAVVAKSVDVVASIIDRNPATQARLLEYFRVN